MFNNLLDKLNYGIPKIKEVELLVTKIQTKGKNFENLINQVENTIISGKISIKNYLQLQ